MTIQQMEPEPDAQNECEKLEKLKVNSNPTETL